MTLAYFIKLVQTMRTHQVAYFKTKSYDSMNAAMKVEREVDRAIDEHDGGQGKLFGESPPAVKPAEFRFNRTTCQNACEIEVGDTGLRIELLIDDASLSAKQVEFMKTAAAVLSAHFPASKLPE